MTDNSDIEELRVLVYDDENRSATDIKARLDALGFLDVKLLDSAEAALQDLDGRRRAARESHTASSTPNQFDEADILVVDYDLTATSDPDAGAAETGERVAYLARCYSGCKTIVALNQFSSRPVFDLTLAGHPSSFADLNISGDEIDNPALWGEASDGYEPWHWPNLRTAPQLFENRVQAALETPDTRVLEMLGIDATRIRNTLTRKQLAYLSPRTEAHAITIRDSVKGGRLGLKPNDEPWGEQGLARVAAARLAKWLECLVIPGQDVLVDEPHLAVRFPSLLHAGLPSRDSLRQGPPALDHARLSNHAFVAPVWSHRAMWLWPTLVDDGTIAEVDDPFAAIRGIGFFAEDVSRLLPADLVRSFTADFEPFSRRYISAYEDADPRRADRHGTGNVEYQPVVAFALA